MFRISLSTLIVLLTAAPSFADDRVDARRLTEVWDELKEKRQFKPEDLANALPEKTAFVDIVRFARFDSKSKKQTPAYVAFVIASGKEPRRVDLGDAAPIDDLAAAWRKAIDKREASPAAAELARRLWQPIAKQIPEGMRTLYLSPDGVLASIPWSAIPGTKADTVLLEEFAGGIAYVPHSQFLLEGLKRSPIAAKEPDKVLAVGGIDFAPSKYAALPGTEAEVKAIKATAGNRPVTILTGKEATAKKLAEELPKAQIVHIATVGEFDAEGLAKEKKRAEAQLKNRQFNDEPRRVVSKNPLGFVRLVLSGGEAMSGIEFLDLPLDKTKLVTLSACETALGEYIGGKGVESLQNAFHIAGCPNVIASLWRVNDAATAALMAKFYHEMWVNKLEPLAALRTAQLAIYHHPELIPELAGERDAPKKQKDAKPQAKKRADTKLWAAFVLSGVGK